MVKPSASCKSIVVDYQKNLIFLFGIFFKSQAQQQVKHYFNTILSIFHIFESYFAPFIFLLHKIYMYFLSSQNFTLIFY